MKPYASAKLRDDGVPMEFDTAGVAVTPGDHVVLETELGEQVATVVPDVPSSCGACTGCALKKSPARLLRLASEEDRLSWEAKREQESEAFRSCTMKIKERGLPMKLIRAEYEPRESRVVFHFTADERIDFRSLVRELTREFRFRVEMLQVGPRDAAGMVGGYGSCGRPLCCSTFLKKFRPISIKMAKRQNLTLNPSKLTGLCGRLKCCLAYEYDG